MNTDWPEFEACIRAKISSSSRQLELTAELYERILLADPHNIKRLSNILALEKLILDERFKLVALLQKYRECFDDLPISSEAASRYAWN